MTAVPLKSTWEANMTEFGGYLSTYLNNNPSNDNGLAASYYDAMESFYRIRAYTGDTTTWDTAITRSRAPYRDYYVTPNSGGVPGFWNFTHGLTSDWLTASNTTSKTAVNLLATNGAYAVSTPSADSELQNFHFSRENAYVMMAYMNNVRVGNALNSRLSSLLENALSHLNQWTVSRTATYVRPFMMALTCRALIQYNEIYGDSRIVPAMKTAWDWAWDNMWRSGDATPSFKYTDVDTSTFASSASGYNSGGTEGSNDLSLLIAPCFGYLYYKLGTTTYRTRGDAVWSGGVSVYDGAFHQSGAYLGARNATGINGKHFCQNYVWSFDYVTWAESTPQIGLPAHGAVGNRRHHYRFFSKS